MSIPEKELPVSRSCLAFLFRQILILSFICVPVVNVHSQTVELCTGSEADPAEQAEQISCLIEAVKALEASKTMAEQALMLIVKDIDTFRKETIGPPKIITNWFPEQEVGIFYYRNGQGDQASADCRNAPMTPTEGFVGYGLFVGQAKLPYDLSPSFLQIPCVNLYLSGCGIGECFYKSVSEGCIINSEWLSWHLSKPGATTRVEDICRQLR